MNRLDPFAPTEPCHSPASPERSDRATAAAREAAISAGHRALVRLILPTRVPFGGPRPVDLDAS